MRKRRRGLLIFNIVLPILIVLGCAALFLQNYLYNTLERVCDLGDAERDGTFFRFDEVTVELTTRGGDSGSWESSDLYDQDGNLLHELITGTIYELVLTNNTSNPIVDWTAKLYIPEDMYVNNTWNGDFEYHQHAGTENEKIQTLDLAEYTNYDITLDHVITWVGPFVELDEGDYFIYYPDAEMGEVPIAAKSKDAEKESGSRIGFIMYIPDRTIDYVADFTRGEVRYHLHTSIFTNPIFPVLCVMIVAWISALASMIIVRSNLKRFVEQQKRDEKVIEQTMRTFVNFIEAKDPSTMGHSVRVAEYSRLIAEKLGYSEEECKRVYWIALMHDCGKIYIPDEILTKPGRLTDEEYGIMKKHTVYGSDILRDFTSIDGMGTGALSHHERYDGSGYPNGLAGDEIPIIGRMICVSDAFDAMNSRRCYRGNLEKKIILKELNKNRGKQFDPKMVDCLLALIDEGRIAFSDITKE
ncbi:MAG: HD domain-containing protein [Bacteroides sp.]|nr:HD domain-containing protein [Eubacterium sp.]MCM1419235.1 HD domain-containing protein [Roseburia sp.]MCM1463091.1 HD domain-containing protein [Bacteroides sp.]